MCGCLAGSLWLEWHIPNEGKLRSGGEGAYPKKTKVV